MTEINIDASELEDARNSVLSLAKNLRTDSTEMQQEEPDNMQNRIRESVRKNFEDVRTGRNTSLLEAFQIVDSAGGKKITTAGMNAPHAAPLERGMSGHTIEGNPTLAFQPENIDEYPESSHAGGGYVVLPSVQWEPDKAETEKGYDYVFEAQRVWDTAVRGRISKRIQESIIRAGYRRSV